MNWRWGWGEMAAAPLWQQKQLPPSPSCSYPGPRGSKQGLVGANEGLFPAGTFVFIAEEAVNQRLPKETSTLPGFVCMLCLPAAGIVMGFSQLKKAESLCHSPLPPIRKKHSWMIPHDSNMCRTWGLGIVFTLIVTCEHPPLLVRFAFKEIGR